MKTCMRIWIVMIASSAAAELGIQPPSAWAQDTQELQYETHQADSLETSAEEENRGYLAWEGGYCYEFNGGGKRLQQVDDTGCPGSNRRAWEQGNCYEFNSAGRRLQQVNDAGCTPGASYTDWSHSTCYLYNQSFVRLNQMGDASCSGSGFVAWEHGSCYLFNATRIRKNRVSDALCR